MPVLLNQSLIVPVYVDIFITRAPKRAFADVNLVLRGIHSVLAKGETKIVERVRWKGKWRKVSVRAKPIYAKLEAEGLYGIAWYYKFLRGRYVRLEYVPRRPSKRDILYVVTNKENLLAEARHVVLESEEPIVLESIVQGYSAVALIVENLSGYIPSKTLIEDLEAKNVDVYVLPFKYELLAYRPLRYMI